MTTGIIMCLVLIALSVRQLVLERLLYFIRGVSFSRRDSLPQKLSGWGRTCIARASAMDGRVFKNPFERFTQKGAAFALCMCLLAAGCFTSCSISGDKPDDNLYFVVGYDGTSEINIQKGTAKSLGYLLISEAYKSLLLDINLIDNISSGSLDDIILLTNLIVDDFGNCIDDPFDGIIDFPEESMPTEEYCGYRLFPEEYRFVYKVRMTYRPMTEEEERYVPRLIFHRCYNPLYFRLKFNNIVIKSISKI